MGIFDFFRKKQEAQKENEKISVNEISSWVEKKSLDTESKRDSFLELKKGIVSRTITGINEGVNSLNDLNWDKIKAEDKIKRLVKSSLGIYSGHLEQLVEDLESLKELDRDKINSLFKNFDKKASMSYEKSSFLIGKELGVINKVVQNFFKELDKAERDNSDLLNTLRVISVVKNKLEKLESLDKERKEVKVELGKIENELELARKMVRNAEDEIKGMKKTEEYLERERKRNKLESDKETLKMELSELSVLIDFKFLARMWHENEREMNIIKAHREDFKKAFLKDDGKSIVGLIDKSGVDKSHLNDILSRVAMRTMEIENANVGSSLTLELENKINKKMTEIERINGDKDKKEKRVSKLAVIREGVIVDITEEMKKIGVEVEG